MLSPSSGEPLRRRVPRLHEIAWLIACVAALVGQAWFGQATKSPNADVIYHYTFGETLAGIRGYDRHSLPGDGTAPFCALVPLAARLGPPAEPVVTDVYTIPNLAWARLPGIAAAMLVLVLAWAAARAIAGPLAGAGAAAVAALTPDFIGHARFIGTDVAGTLGWLAALLAIAAALARPTWGRLALAAAVIALAQWTKLVNAVWLPLGVVAVGVRCVVAAHRGECTRGGAVTRGVGFAVAVGALTFAAIHAGYAGISADAERVYYEDGFDNAIDTFGPPFPRVANAILPRAYVLTIAAGGVHRNAGHASYLNGDYSRNGWPHYFAVALAVKMPIALLVLAAAGVVVGIVRRSRLVWWLLGCAALHFALLSFVGNVHIGVRHMLPVIAVLFVLAGVAVGAIARSRVGIGLVTALGAWLVVDVARIYPHHAEYFNAFAGGPYEGWRTLIDSNVDWAQDRRLMREWAEAQRGPVAIDPIEPVAGTVVVRANVLVGVDADAHAKTAWLRAFEPVDRLSPGVFVFDVPASAVSGDR